MNGATAVGADHVGELRFQRALHFGRIPDEANQHDQQDQQWRQRKNGVVGERGGANSTAIVTEVLQNLLDEAQHWTELPAACPEQQRTDAPAELWVGCRSSAMGPVGDSAARNWRAPELRPETSLQCRARKGERGPERPDEERVAIEVLAVFDLRAGRDRSHGAERQARREIRRPDVEDVRSRLLGEVGFELREQRTERDGGELSGGERRNVAGQRRA